MHWKPTLRAITLATLAAYAALIVGVWLAPPAMIRHAASDLPVALEASTTTYRAVATVVIASVAALVGLSAWSWRTRPSRPFQLATGEPLAVATAATLLRQAILRRSDIRTAQVAVEHRWGSVAASVRLEVTTDALLADIEEHARVATVALASRVNEPLSKLTVAISFKELNLVAARARRAATAGQLRAA
jgi:hypothetical protein